MEHPRFRVHNFGYDLLLVILSLIQLIIVSLFIEHPHFATTVL